GLDLALIVNDGPADVVAGVFTTNRVCAAPVQWSRHATADHKARAVIVNAAVANACTGIDGFADCDITFSRVDSDACMSTNDTVVAMASGA
ncbi:bifunctional ornithine acetyltransferase/N-acetylglutamate synthase, partial [Pseudomonas aeruginosa]